MSLNIVFGVFGVLTLLFTGPHYWYILGSLPFLQRIWNGGGYPFLVFL